MSYIVQYKGRTIWKGKFHIVCALNITCPHITCIAIPKVHTSALPTYKQGEPLLVQSHEGCTWIKDLILSEVKAKGEREHERGEEEQHTGSGWSCAVACLSLILYILKMREKVRWERRLVWIVGGQTRADTRLYPNRRVEDVILERVFLPSIACFIFLNCSRNGGLGFLLYA